MVLSRGEAETSTSPSMDLVEQSSRSNMGFNKLKQRSAVNGAPVVPALPADSAQAELFDAARRNDIRLTKRTLSKVNSAQCRDEDGNTPVHVAAREGSLDVLQCLANQGQFIIDDVNCRGHCPLHFAAMKGHMRVVRFLVGAGANVNLATNMGCTALYFASSMGHADVVETLAAAGASVNTETAQHSTPLLAAAFKGFEEVTHILLRHKADPNFQNERGMSPMHAAAERAHAAILALLVNNGGDSSLVDNQNRTANDIMAEKVRDSKQAAAVKIEVPLAMRHSSLTQAATPTAGNVNTNAIRAAAMLPTVPKLTGTKGSHHGGRHATGSGSRGMCAASGIEVSPTSSTASS